VKRAMTECDLKGKRFRAHSSESDLQRQGLEPSLRDIVSSKGIQSIIVERTSLELQRINVKILSKDPENLDLDPVIPVFHSWIQAQVCEELLLDVADYRHVHGGPGIVLIGHEADYSLDNTNNRWGARYNRKTVIRGNNQKRLEQAVRAALIACQRLQRDDRLKYHFKGEEIEISVNDRALAPNSQETREAFTPEIQAFAERLFCRGEYSLSFDADSRRLLRAFLKASRSFTVDELLDNLAS
jgi:hypothetical protein